MKHKMCLPGETKQVEVRNTAIDDVLTLITQDLVFFKNSDVAIIWLFTLIIIMIISIFINRLGDDHEAPNIPRRNDSLDDSSLNNDEATKHERYLSELYSAADKCFIKKYAERCRKLVNRCPYMINAMNASTGQTPFHRVCFHGEVSLIEFMLEKGANPHLNSEAGESPICLALYYYMSKKNDRDVESISCLEILQRAGSKLGQNSVWYDILLRMTIRANKISLTNWLLTNGRYASPCGIAKIARNSSEPPVMKI